jgi:hypothetical protein
MSEVLVTPAKVGVQGTARPWEPGFPLSRE